MSNSPLVSIIVPVYNTEQYLKICLDSIIIQSYKNIEILLIDDGSTDDSHKICKQYAEKDKRIKVFQQKNAGQGVARNLGLDNANGKYIAFVDSDDYIRQDMISLLVSACEENHVSLCVCGYAIDSINIVSERKPKPRLLTHDELMHDYLTTPDICGCPWNKLYRSELFDELRFPSMRANEDAYIMPDIFHKCKTAAVISDALYIQFLRMGSTERSGYSEKSMCIIDAELHLKEIVEMYYPKESNQIQLRIAREYRNIMKKAATYRNRQAFFHAHRQMLIELDSIKSSNNIHDIKLMNELVQVGRYSHLTFFKDAIENKVFILKQKIKTILYKRNIY